MYKKYIKRLLDIIISIILIILLLPLFIIMYIITKIEFTGNAIYKQKRIGLFEKNFTIYKFKTMDDKTKKVTKVSRLIRKIGIDEIPQLFNVLKGDMSLVGTRPPTEDEFEQYNGYYRRRMSITPGLTGMWQVSGRSDIQDFEEIVKLDLEYIDNWSLLLDIKILFKTVFIVLGRKGSK